MAEIRKHYGHPSEASGTFLAHHGGIQSGRVPLMAKSDAIRVQADAAKAGKQCEVVEFVMTRVGDLKRFAVEVTA